MPNYSIKQLCSVQNISDEVFEQLGCGNTFYFSKPFLSAFEEANVNITYTYLLFEQKNTPVALAIIQSMDVTLDGASTNLPLTQKLARSLQCYLTNRKTHIMVCGNVFLSGEYGLWIKNDIDRRSVYDTLSRKLKTLTTAKKASIFFLKDFNAAQDTAASVTEKQQFQSFAVEPNMRLPILWDNFESYKTALKSKYRIKVNKADSLSSQLKASSLTAKEIRYHSRELQVLHCNITEKALFNAVDIEIETYALLKERFDENISFNVYFKDEKIVGFMTAFKTGDTLDAHFIGINYDFNKTDAIYPRMLNDYVRLGLSLGVKEINLGRTASEIKSTIGAVPEHLRCYVKHRRTVTNMLFKPLIRQIKMTEYKQHTPFKK